MKLKHLAARIKRRKQSKGGWAVEASGALGLLVMLVGFGMYNETRSNDKSMSSVAAAHHKKVMDGASAYVRDNYSTILSSVPAVGNTTKISFATLQSSGYVPSTLSSTNIWGQSFGLRVRRSSVDPKAIQLEGLVLTEGGSNISHEIAREVAQNIGAEGGYTVASGDYCGATKVTTSTLCGARSVWVRPVADFGSAVPAGRIASALFFQNGKAVNDYLYRSYVPGKPELNTMETYLQMGTGATAVAGQPCYSVAGDSRSPILRNGAIATTSAGLILSCQSGVWKSALSSTPGQWRNVAAQRSVNQVYKNGDRLLAVMISARIGERYTGEFCVDASCIQYGDGDWHNRWPVTLIVPPGSEYGMRGGGNILGWHELYLN